MNTDVSDSKFNERVLRPKEFAKKHTFLSESALRWLLFNSHKNGLETALIRLGRRVLIDENLFFEWLNSQRKGDQK